MLPYRIQCKQMGPECMPLPMYARDGDAGLDLRASLKGRDLAQIIISGYYRTQVDGGPIRLGAGTRACIPVGWAFEIPADFEGQVRGRSGWTGRGLWVAIGTVDSGYRGEVSVHVRAMCDVVIKHGDRIAQLVIAPVLKVALVATNDLEPTVRGTNGFGSTGD